MGLLCFTVINLIFGRVVIYFNFEIPFDFIEWELTGPMTLLVRVFAGFILVGHLDRRFEFQPNPIQGSSIRYL